jgi:hypothetical protein
MELDLSCPYCGEPVSLWIDESGGRVQTYIEDCAVCCQPIQIDVRHAADGEFDVSATRGDGE